MVDTARYWASRIRRDSAGRGHLDRLMGPDEYHQLVDDNAYTNVMARWNLRRGAELLTQTKGDPQEAETWRALADCLVDGWDPGRGLYEQFAGYFDLEPLLMREIGTPPLAVDVMLGAERVARSQLIKQADVLMLYHLVPDEMVSDSLGESLAFYEPRTAHGSSLSPAISAALLARAGQPERALELFRLAARLDLDDLTGTTAGGLHLATMGGVWQALAYGFLGLRAETDALAINPSLPEEWSALGLRFSFRGRRVGVRAEHDSITVRCDGSLSVRIGHQGLEQCEEPGRIFRITDAATSKGIVMSITLACLDTTHTAQSVLEVALRVGEMTGTDVEAVHVPTGPDQSLKLRTDQGPCPVAPRLRPTRTCTSHCDSEPEVADGGRGRQGSDRMDKRLLGTTARHIIERSSKPVVIVPPELSLRAPFAGSSFLSRAPNPPPDRWSKDCFPSW